MVRISLQEQYDNKDVIQQIKKLKDDTASVLVIAEEAAEGVELAKDASVKANEAISIVNNTVLPKLDEHSASIAAVETEAEQALTDANDAFDEAQITQTNVAATLVMTRGTGLKENIPFPIASAVQTGMMNAQTYNGLVNLGDRVTKLEQTKTVYYVTFSSETPAQGELTALFASVSGRSPTAGDYLTDIAKNLTYGYSGTEWIKVDTSGGITPFTNENPGLIKGSLLDGTISAETDGTGSVVGWDTVKEDINNAKGEISTLQTDLSTTEGEVASAQADIASLQTSVAGKQGTITAVTVTLLASNWDDTTLTQTVGATNVTASNIVWVSPAPASFDAYGKAGIRATAQSQGNIAFTCAKIPTENITVEVVA